MPRYTTTTGTAITTDKQLGVGGEGTVYTVQGMPQTVAKIYHATRLTPILADKVTAMVADPPEDDARRSLNHVSIAWPEQILTSNGKFVGYLMPKIPKSDDLYDLLQPQQRAKQHPQADHRMIYRTARNFATAVAAIHRKNYVLGDVNFKNALFTDQALITIVDCDSMQVTDSHGVVHRCLVGLPEYTAPELQGADFSAVNRTTDSDTFGVAVLLFQLLMQGFHPFAGRPLPGAPDVEQVHVYCIAHTIFPYEQNSQFVPPKAAPAITCLPGNLRTLFQRAFTERKRPSAQEWADALAMVEKRLVQCSNDGTHWYPADGACVICDVDFNAGRRQRTTPLPATQMQVPYTPSTPVSSPSKPTPAPTRSTFTIPSSPSPSLKSPNPSQSGSAPTRTQRSSMTAIGVIVACVFIILGIWFGSSNTPSAATTLPTSASEPAATVDIAPVTTQATVVPQATAMPTAAPVADIPCTQHALLQHIWPDSYGAVLPQMAVATWPQTLTEYYGEPPKLTNVPRPSTLVDVDTPLTARLACQGGTVSRLAIASLTGSGLGCDATTCGERTPLFREYQAVLYGENTPSRDNYVAGKSAITRFFAVPGSKPRYTALILDAEQSDYQLFLRYQLPLVQLEFRTSKESDFTSTTVDAAPVWYDMLNGRQTRVAPMQLPQWKRTFTIPSGQTWRTGTAVQAQQYQRWFAGCADHIADIPQCATIQEISIITNNKFSVTYLPGVTKEMAKGIQPQALPPDAPNADIADIATMLSDTMSKWSCTPRQSDNTWRCETVSQLSASTSNMVTFYRYTTRAALQDAMTSPYDIVLASADATPSLAAYMALHPLPATTTFELVPTGALYVVTRQ